ncbi:hypothetical protein QAD02_006528 [Eretmocerus hayati]|uniref:Uncharacterized protein n=1 Tax=Eretmocerus hayati TaxID=131215 RepID=A0ACC2N1H3_9HYME|nr:hypothetical protein QAD02_006528 [Eretmocerus hayati]
MILKLILSNFLIIVFGFHEVDCYGRVLNPVHRGSAWRKGIDAPVNYEDNMNNCGGYTELHEKNNGTCGPCGDDFANSVPRDNENGGKYGTGIIVKLYEMNQVIDIEVDLTANLGGHFEFSICDLYQLDTPYEYENCFKPLLLEDGRSKFELPDASTVGIYTIKVQLPQNLVCVHCVLRWQYVAANNWGICPNGTGKLGCGPQEMFRTCSDISVR